MKASLVAFDCRELQKNLEIIIVKYESVRGCPKKLATQIESLKILGVKVRRLSILSLILVLPK
jgi:hypothetical protein